MLSQVKKDHIGFFTDRYQEIVDLLRSKAVTQKIDKTTKGVPLEFYEVRVYEE